MVWDGNPYQSHQSFLTFFPSQTCFHGPCFMGFLPICSNKSIGQSCFIWVFPVNSIFVPYFLVFSLCSSRFSHIVLVKSMNFPAFSHLSGRWATWRSSTRPWRRRSWRSWCRWRRSGARNRAPSCWRRRMDGWMMIGVYMAIYIYIPSAPNSLWECV